MNCSACFREVSCPVCGRLQHALGVEHEGAFLFMATCLEARGGCGVTFDDEGPVNGLLTMADREAHERRGLGQAVCGE